MTGPRQGTAQALLMAAIALFFGLNALRYPAGTLARFGPGFFPLVVSTALLVLAVAMLVRSRLVASPPVEFGLRNIGLILAALVGFVAASSLLDMGGWHRRPRLRLGPGRHVLLLGAQCRRRPGPLRHRPCLRACARPAAERALTGVLDNLLFGFSHALSLENLLYCATGCVVGTIVGLLPGLGPLATISLLLPLTYAIPTGGALIMLAGIYYGAQYGDSVSAITMRIPHAGSIVACIDGYAMTLQGRTGLALFTAGVSSFIGGTVAIVVLATLAPALGQVAILFGPADYCALMVLGFVCVSLVTTGSVLNGLAMCLVGRPAGPGRHRPGHRRPAVHLRPAGADGGREHRQRRTRLLRHRRADQEPGREGRAHPVQRRHPP